MRIRTLFVACLAPLAIAACDDSLSDDVTVTAPIVAETTEADTPEVVAEPGAATVTPIAELEAAPLPTLAELAATPEPLTFGAVGMRVVADESGAIVVRELVDGLPAEDAGLSPGDVVLAVDGMSTEGMTVDTFVDLVRGEPGASVELTVADDASTRTIVLSRSSYTLERSVCDVRRSLARDTEFGGVGIRLSRCDAGTIQSVEAGGPAELAGLVAGDRIVAVDGHDADGADTWALVDAIRGESGTTVALDVVGADGVQRTLEVERVAFVLPEANHCGR